MVWVRKHLNLFLLFLWLAWFILVFICLATQIEALIVTNYIGGIFVLFMASGWVIKQKGRSLWWLLLWPIGHLLVPWLLQSQEQLEEDKELIESISGRIHPPDDQQQA